MNKSNHKRYALLDDGTIEPLYYDVNDTLDWDNLRYIESDDNGENPCLVHDKWVCGGIALCVNKIIKEADTIEELCDEFVMTHYFKETNYTKCEVLKEDKDLKNEFNIYGAIWTDKGLIYVAKLNDKGELELI